MEALATRKTITSLEIATPYPYDDMLKPTTLSNLTSLVIRGRVDLNQQGFVDSAIFGSCSTLKRLTLENLHLTWQNPFSETTVSFPHLRHLSISKCFITADTMQRILDTIDFGQLLTLGYRPPNHVMAFVEVEDLIRPLWEKLASLEGRLRLQHLEIVAPRNDIRLKVGYGRKQYTCYAATMAYVLSSFKSLEELVLVSGMVAGNTGPSGMCPYIVSGILKHRRLRVLALRYHIDEVPGDTSFLALSAKTARRLTSSLHRLEEIEFHPLMDTLVSFSLMLMRLLY